MVHSVGNKALLAAALAAVVGVLVAGCVPVAGDCAPAADGCLSMAAENRLPGWFIQLRVGALPGGRAVTVDEYDVTAVEMEVLGPDHGVLERITWEASPGLRVYMVPVRERGRHTIVVTHVGSLDDRTAEAREYVTVDVLTSRVTVVEIIPGGIGVINVREEHL